MSRPFWPISEPGQADYETLREAVLSGQSPETLAAARFARRGLAGLINWPGAETTYTTVLLGAKRPAWTPHADPCVDALVSAYELILDTALESPASLRVRQ